MKRLILAAATVVLLPSLAWAVPLSADLAALPAWQGTVTFMATDASTTLNVGADFAVYAPGAYGPGDPSLGAAYVYAYEVFNLINPLSVEVSSFTVGIDPMAQVSNVGFDLGGRGVAGTDVPPTFWGVTGSSVVWSFLGQTVVFGQDSATLLFTSPLPPQVSSASVQDGGLSDHQSVPSPLPEPASVAFILAGTGVVVFFRRRRR